MRVFYEVAGLKRNPSVFEPHASALGEHYSYVPDCFGRNICVGIVTARVSGSQERCRRAHVAAAAPPAALALSLAATATKTAAASSTTNAAAASCCCAAER